MERYMYHIHPRKPIVGLFPGRAIRKPMGIKLTKDEVLKCMACGPVYRAFPSIPPIKVTGSNLDSLHVSEEEYLNKPSDSTEKAVDDVIPTQVTPEEPKTEAPTEVIEPEKHEEPVEEKTVNEEKIVIEDENQPDTGAVVDINVIPVQPEEVVEAPEPTEEAPVEEVAEPKTEEVVVDPEPEVTYTDNGDGTFTETTEDDDLVDDAEEDSEEEEEEDELEGTDPDGETPVLNQPTVLLQPQQNNQPRPNHKKKHKR